LSRRCNNFIASLTTAMTTKTPPIPKELAEFINSDGDTFHGDDGDWELRIARGDESEIADELPPRSTVIAENGSGDYLFLKSTAAGKFDPKVFVYWHEEERHEVFARQLKGLMGKAPPKKKGGAKPAIRKTRGASVSQLETALKSPKAAVRVDALRKLAQSAFGVEALPALRRALNDEYVEAAITAAECIAKLGPEAVESPAAESAAAYDHADLEEQLMRVGAKVWSYSGYPNCYTSCLEALVALEMDEDFIIEFIHDHIGLSNPDDLLASLEALQKLGTNDATDLLKRAAVFWMPELNAAQAKKVKAIVAACDSRRRK
jgi:hypothetical protein